ncbi:UNVERIFIED_ORG: hypothetical protein FNL38_105263 [Nocardia globerula]|uniref:Uncharacterized protein n=1 Tax=Nocardia globerula TaxID=1818 RepID=A0A652YN06_NOCGL
MLAATPSRNAVITECETKRVYLPSRKTAATIITPPATRVSITRAADRSSSGISVRADPAASAEALVVVTTIRRVLVDNPPNTRPAMLA